MKYQVILPIVTALCISGCGDISSTDSTAPFSEEEFANPPMQYRPIPLWFWNDTGVNAEEAARQQWSGAW